MRHALLAALRIVLFAAGLGAAAAACFSPLKPACTFACGPDRACPDEYVCSSDGLCHRADGVGQCELSPASPDGSAD
jgi:hypothetical protein